ncbi:MAG: outer membrane lipoprotein chaperone LolA [Deltaproteobacteria bacterium]|nr:outer membrane lipoprotein chaperone LolA [Deltaproteobacteria bacterium]
MSWVIVLLNMLVCLNTSQDVISLLQDRYDKIKDFKTEFIQSYYSTNGTLLLESTGVLYYKKKGMFRWDYKTPKQKQFIVKDNTLWIFLKDDGIVYIDDNFKTSQMKLILLFLYGEGSLEREFNVEKITEDTEFYRILLIPKEEAANLTRLTIHLRRKTYNVEKMEITDRLGNKNVFHFKNLNFDVGLGEALFNFKIPEGVEVYPLPKDMFK